MPRLRVLLLSLAGFTVAAALAAMAPTYWTFALALVPVGLTALTALTTANAMVQTRVAPEMRGRVMALYMAIFMGGTPASALLIGWISEQFGPRWTIGIGAVAVGLVLVGVSLLAGEVGECAGELRVPTPSARARDLRADGVRAADRARAGAGPITPLFRRRMTLGVLGVLVGVAIVYALTRVATGPGAALPSVAADHRPTVGVWAHRAPS